MREIKFSDTSRGSEVGDLIREMRRRYSLAEEISRKFMLACALEPLAEKIGCTTRHTDIKDSKRLELFISAAISSGFAIKHLAEYVIEKKSFVGAYEFLPEAVIASKFNRRFGKINQGELEAFFPVISAQIIHYEKVKDNPCGVLNLASQLLKSTTRRDVEKLIEAKKIANKISGVENKYPVAIHDVENVFDYYLAEEKEEGKNKELTGILHNRQFLDGFSDIRSMLEIMTSSGKERLLERVTDAYDFIRNKYACKIGIGLAADYCAVCLYLYISLVDHREVI